MGTALSLLMLGGAANAALAAPGSAPSDAVGFMETFAGRPAAPTPWHGDDWDIAVHSRDRGTWSAPQPMMAMHGADCSAAPATHLVRTYEDSVFQCNGHLMTAMDATGYGMIYLTPNDMLDLSRGEATVSFDLSTLRTSTRDWVDLWLTPYDENLQLPLDSWVPDMHGEPRDAVHVRMDWFNDSTIFRVSVVRNFQVEEVQQSSWTGLETVLAQQGLQPSAVRRDTFALQISPDHVRFGMPTYNAWWVDQSIAPLGWSRGVVQLGDHSYNPLKECQLHTGCGPNTWHWGNVRVSPAVPFTILRADRRMVDASTAGQPLSFPAPAPADSRLRFAAVGKQVEVSFDGGRSWAPAQEQAQKPGVREGNAELFDSYWTPAPEGATQVLVRAQDWASDGPWEAQDVSIWSSTAPAPASSTAVAASDQQAAG